MNTNTKPILQWQAPARIDHDRSQRWYLIAGGIALLLIGYGMLFGSWLFSFAIGLICALYYLARDEKHPAHTIRIFDIGIEFDGAFKPWNYYQNFWILQCDTYSELHVQAASGLKRELLIHTGSVDPYLLRDTLLEFLPMDATKTERLLDAFIRFCKL